jgi:hypothetical protein
MAFYYNVFHALSDADFRRHFRMRRDLFNRLCDTVKPIMIDPSRAHRPSYPIDLKVAVCLWRLGETCAIRTISALFGVGEATIFLWLKQFYKAVHKKMGHLIAIPPIGSPERLRTFRAFQQKSQRGTHYGLSQVLGAIDGTHFPLSKAPLVNPDDYYSRYQIAPRSRGSCPLRDQI